MSDLRPTRHAAARMSQRGIAPDDLRLVVGLGTEVEGGYLLRRKDYEEYAHLLRRLDDRARKLVGKRVVVREGVVVTAYHSSSNDEQRLLRDIEDANA